MIVVSYSVMLAASTTLGFLGHPTEMGFAIISGALGLFFVNIDKIARFKGAGFEAEMRKIETIINTQTEPTPEQEEQAVSAGALNETEVAILKALLNSNYTWRYRSTIANVLAKSDEETGSILMSLMKRGFVKRDLGANEEIWAATIIGKIAIEQNEIGRA